MPSDILAAFLLAQLEQADRLLSQRRAVWQRYHQGLAALEKSGCCRRPIVPEDCDHNAHIYYLLLRDGKTRDAVIAKLRTMGIRAPFHYVPLHNSPAGLRFGRTAGRLKNTEDLAARVLRLPLWYGMVDEPEQVIQAVRTILE